jgi:hypothetical protein
MAVNILTSSFTTGAGEQNPVKTAVTDFRAINDQIEQMRSHPMDINTDQLTTLTTKIAALKQNKPWSLDLNMDRAESSLQTLREIYDEAEKIRGIKTKYPDLQGDQQKAQGTIDDLGRKFPEAGTKADELKNKVGGVTSAIGGSVSAMGGFQDEIQGAITMVGDLAQAIYSLPSPSDAMTAAHGGMVFLAGGGRPRGTDTIPAMLSKGEMVMNAATTRQFAPQLTAMNAGVRPSYHSVGGHVTNIGDINVKVEGGGSGRQTARSIATELRRELRRGTSTL